MRPTFEPVLDWRRTTETMVTHDSVAEEDDDPDERLGQRCEACGYVGIVSKSRFGWLCIEPDDGSKAMIFPSDFCRLVRDDHKKAEDTDNDVEEELDTAAFATTLPKPTTSAATSRGSVSPATTRTTSAARPRSSRRPATRRRRPSRRRKARSAPSSRSRLARSTARPTSTRRFRRPTSTSATRPRSTKRAGISSRARKKSASRRAP